MNDPIPTFDYFVVRLNRTDPSPDRITGLVERLGSGEKKPFDTAEHLTRLIASWRVPGLNEEAGRSGTAPARSDR
jgi:hypothetical protein